MKHAVKHIHFVGIGGAGMSGIAEVLRNLGYLISGSDLADSADAAPPAEPGHQDLRGPRGRQHRSAPTRWSRPPRCRPDNPEVLAARKRMIPVVPRAMMLAELMRLKQGIAIAGTHGKTTTTSLVASVLAEGGLDPTFVIGGRLNSAGANAKLGSGDYIVVEADESDASFLNLMPVMAVVTNIDADHMETYGHDFGKLKEAFLDFLHRMPFYGTAILCIDDPAVRDIVPDVQCPVTSYGVSEEAQVRAVDVRAVGEQMHFTVQRRNGVTLPDLQVKLNLPGITTCSMRCRPSPSPWNSTSPTRRCCKALAEFKGVGRRFQSYGEVPVRAAQRRRQVHRDRGLRPSPGRDGRHAGGRARRLPRPPPGAGVPAAPLHPHPRLFEDFVKVIGHADAVLLAEVYAAGEAPIVAADGRSLARAVRVAGKVEPVFVDDIADDADAILDMARDGDVVICMGAGSIGGVPAKLVETEALRRAAIERLHART